MLEDADISELADIASAKEQNLEEGKDANDSPAIGKVRGMSILNLVKR